jgi:alkylhydroperoxidase/carboxymuconolactone decarboxylase family protein YurZ
MADGLQYQDVVAAQTANPPQFGQQGQVTNPQANTTPTGLASMAQPQATGQSTGQVTDTSGQGQPSTQSNPYALAQAVTDLEAKYNINNSLMTQRNIALNALYGMSVSQQDMASLNPTLQKVIQSGDKNQTELQIRLINDQITGRANTLDQSVQYLITAYNQNLQQQETNRQNAISNVQNFVQQYGSQAGSALKALYGDQYVQQLAGMGINLQSFEQATVPTIAETRYQAQYGTSGASISIPSNTLAGENNNPGNLRFIGQQGATQGQGGFAAFSTPEAGYQALISDIGYKMSGQSTNPIPDGPHAGQTLGPNATLEDMIRVYAPTADGNNPVSYAQTVATQLGVSPQTPLSKLQASDLAPLIAQHESGTTVTQPDIQLIAQRIINGTIPPPISARGTITATPSNLKLEAAISKAGGNLTNIALDWASMQKWLTSANSTTQLRLRQAISSVQQGIEGLRTASAAWDAGGFAPLNAANLTAALNGVYGQQAQQVAAQFQQQATIITDELGQTFMGGNSPTDKALSLAGSVLNTNWSKDTLDSALTNLDTNLGYRLNAIQTTGPIGAGGDMTNQYANFAPSTGTNGYQAFIDAVNKAQ